MRNAFALTRESGTSHTRIAARVSGSVSRGHLSESSHLGRAVGVPQLAADEAAHPRQVRRRPPRTIALDVAKTAAAAANGLEPPPPWTRHGRARGAPSCRSGLQQWAGLRPDGQSAYWWPTPRQAMQMARGHSAYRRFKTVARAAVLTASPPPLAPPPCGSCRRRGSSRSGRGRPCAGRRRPRGRQCSAVAAWRCACVSPLPALAAERQAPTRWPRPRWRARARGSSREARPTSAGGGRRGTQPLDQLDQHAALACDSFLPPVV